MKVILSAPRSNRVEVISMPPRLDKQTSQDYSVVVDDPDTDANTSGVILADKDTVFRVTWENTTQGNDLSGLFALHRIQQSLSAGDDIQQLSNIRTPADNIILKPMTHHKSRYNSYQHISK